MRKNTIHQVIKGLGSGRELTGSLSVSNCDAIISDVLTKHFLVVGKDQIKNIQAYTSGRDLNFQVQKSVRRIGMHVLRIISSSRSKKPTKRDLSVNYNSHVLPQMMSSPGIALEKFLVYMLEKYTPSSSNTVFDIAPVEMDNIGIDFISRLNGITFGNQLTYRERDDVQRKEVDVNNSAVTVDHPEKTKPATNEPTKKANRRNALIPSNYASGILPDVPVLFIINSNTSRKLYQSSLRGNPQNIFKNAYDKWKKQGFSDSGPETYLGEDILSELILTTQSYHIALENFISFLSNTRLDLRKVTSYRKNMKGGNFNFSYQPANNTFEVTFYKDSGDSEEFIYIIRFYVTSKILKKLHSTQHIDRVFQTPLEKERKKTTKSNSGKTKRMVGRRKYKNHRRSKKT